MGCSTCCRIDVPGGEGVKMGGGGGGGGTAEGQKARTGPRPFNCFKQGKGAKAHTPTRHTKKPTQPGTHHIGKKKQL